MIMPSWSRIGSYAASKLGAAGVVFAGFLLILGRLDWYDISEMMREIPLWFFFYVYAIAFSVMVDVLLIKLKQEPAKLALTVLLYLLGGYVPFLFIFPNNWMISLIAGFYGVACSLIFLAGTQLFSKKWPYNGFAALLLLAGAIYVATGDFTETRGWTEERTADGYRAEFDYFHGYRKIPVQLQAGQTLAYRIEWQASGGYGTYLDTEGVKGTHVSTDRHGEGWISYKTEETSAVFIVITGKRAEGALAIRWEIIDEEERL